MLDQTALAPIGLTVPRPAGVNVLEGSPYRVVRSNPYHDENGNFASSPVSMSRDLTSAESRTVSEYAYNSGGVNDPLRDGTNPVGGFSTAQMDSAIAVGSLSQETVLTRYATDTLLPTNAVGMTFSDKAYMSTCIDARWKDTFGGEGTAEYRITAPAGTPAAWPDAPSEKEQGEEWQGATGEVTLGRDTILEVTGDRVEDGQRIVDCRVVTP